MTGVTDEHRLAEAFAPGLPFASLLVVFYVIVAMIHTQNMFRQAVLNGEAAGLPLRGAQRE